MQAISSLFACRTAVGPQKPQAPPGDSGHIPYAPEQGKRRRKIGSIAGKTGLTISVSGITRYGRFAWGDDAMGPPKWDFSAAIEELKKGDLRRKQGPVALRVSPAKIQAELHRAVECYFTNKATWLTPSTKVKAKHGLLLGDLDRARAKLTEIFQNPAQLRPLIASDKDYQGTSYSCQRLLSTFDRLYDRVKAAEQASASRVRGGRVKSPHRESLFLDLCGRYEKYTGRAPGRLAAHGHGRDAGPFVRFVTAVFEEIEPEEARTAKLASAVSKAIAKWKATYGRQGKQIDNRSSSKWR